MIWIEDKIKDQKELIEETKKTLLRGWKDEFCNDAEKVLKDENAVKVVMSSVLSFEEFVRGITSITLNMHFEENFGSAIGKWRTSRKNSLSRCSPADELQAISKGLSEEMKNRLIAEAKAVRTKSGEVIVHPLLMEVANEWKRRQ